MTNPKEDNNPVLKRLLIGLLATALFWPGLLLAAESSSESSSAPESDPGPPLNPVDQRLEAEDASDENPFVLTAHRPNYLLTYSYNFTPNEVPFEEEQGQIDHTEIKFQISIKYKVIESIFPDNGDLYFAYTNQSYWQAFNDDLSSPFREINHEPEFWIQFQPRLQLGTARFSGLALGFTHESNGRGGSLSRSWNRIYLNFLWEMGNLALALKPWYRLPEDEKTDPAAPHGDDNPNIEKYMGNGELTLAYHTNGNTFSAVLRNNLRARNKGSIEMGWSFPLFRRLKGYVQYFNGYGESLLDYDAYTNRIGAGFLLTDWL
ncbi:MAG: phospholipase A [Desulfosarcinaceae bacterium]|nr:phospholipase A [Desulfosarcinaceae bacterium]